MVDLTTNTSWQTEQRNREVSRLESILRNPKATHEEKRIAASQLTYWQNENNYELS